MMTPAQHETIRESAMSERREEIERRVSAQIRGHARSSDNEPIRIQLWFWSRYDGPIDTFTEDEIDFVHALLAGAGWYIAPGFELQRQGVRYGYVLHIYSEEPAPEEIPEKKKSWMKKIFSSSRT